MPRFAAIDVGSNALRLRVVEAATPDGLREIASERAPVRLGRDVFLTGRLTTAALSEAVDALRGFRDVMKSLGVDAYRAVATSAVREAANGAILVERSEREAGIRLEVVEGIEEARLVMLGVSSHVRIGDRRALLVDIGGGSVELTEMSGPNARHSVSLPLGSVRLHEAFLDPDGPVTPARSALLTEYIERMLHEAPMLGDGKPDLVVATGGNAEAIAGLCPVSTADGPGIAVARLDSLRDDLSAMTSKLRRERYGLRGDRADVIVPAMHVLGYIARATGVSEMVTPGVGVKEGILREIIDRAFSVWDERREQAAVEAVALDLGRKYHFDEAHAKLVTELSSSLYDQLADVHHLGDEERTWLRLAAILHDIGDFVGYESHHKHTYYLVTHADFMGLTPSAREIVANVARYHRKAHPDLSHPGYRKLDRRGRAVVRKLAAILRVADAFDREHQGKVKDLAVRLTPGRIALRATGDGDLALERWTALRKADLMEDAFECVVKVDGAEGMSDTRVFA